MHLVLLLFLFSNHGYHILSFKIGFWLHDNQIVPSTLHQCIKYLDQFGETVRIFADKKPFTVAESFYADAKFYFEPVEKVHKLKAIIVPE